MQLATASHSCTDELTLHDGQGVAPVWACVILCLSRVQKLVSAIDHYGSGLCDVNIVDSKVSPVVLFNVFTEFFILTFVGHVHDFHVDQSAQWHDSICPVFRRLRVFVSSKHPVTFIGCLKRIDEEVRLFKQFYFLGGTAKNERKTEGTKDNLLKCQFSIDLDA